jgi:hypothetical protein
MIHFEVHIDNRGGSSQDKRSAGKVSIDRSCCSQAAVDRFLFGGLTKVRNSSCKTMLLSASPLGHGEASCAYYVRVR